MASQGTSLVRTIVAAKLLGPSVYGIWLGLRLIVDYGSSLDLGVLTAMLRNVALLRGRGDDRAAQQVLSTSFTFAVAIGFLAALVLAAVAIAWPNPAERQVLVGIGTLLLVNLARSYFVCYIKANQRFGVFAVSSCFGGAVALATLPLMIVWGLAGFVWGIVLQGVVEMGWLLRTAGVPRPRISWKVLKAQLAFGLPATAIVFAYTLFTSIDRTLILAVLDAEHLGRYGIAYICMLLVSILAGVPSVVLSPRMSERYGQTGRATDLAPLMLGPLPLLSIVYAVLVGAAAIGLPPIVHRFLPKYIDGLRAAQIVVLAGYCLAPIGLAASCISTLHQLKRYGFLLLAAAGVTYVVGRLALSVRPTLTMVAVAVSVGLVGYLTAIMIVAHRAVGRRTVEAFAALATIGRPILLVAACVAFVEVLVGRVFPSGSFEQAVVGEVVLFGTTGFWLWKRVKQGARGALFAVK